MGKKMLIIARSFAPWNVIGAVRPTKLAKYLKINHDYEITVVCSEPIAKDVDSTRLDDLKYVSEYISVNCNGWAQYTKRILGVVGKKHAKVVGKNYLGDKQSYSSKKLSIKGMIRRVAELVNEENGKVFEKRAMKRINALDKKFDVILSTFAPLSDHAIAYAYKEAHPETIWIADFRDPLLWTNYRFNGQLYDNLKIEHLIAQKADKIVCVSDSAIVSDDVDYCVLSNGFDPDDVQNASASEPLWNDNKFHIVYTGTIYHMERVEFFFQALRELLDDGRIDINKIEIDYAGRKFFWMNDVAKQYNLTSVLKDFGVVEHNTSLRMQKSAQLLLYFTVHTQYLQWQISGKIYEYFISETPIIGMISGDANNAPSKRMIEESGRGYCYEEASPETWEKAKDYIVEKYNEFFETGKTTCSSDMSKIDEYSYVNLAARFDKLVDEC